MPASSLVIALTRPVGLVRRPESLVGAPAANPHTLS